MIESFCFFSHRWKSWRHCYCCGRKAFCLKLELNHCFPHFSLCICVRLLGGMSIREMITGIQLVARNLSTHGQDLTSGSVCDSPFTLHMCITYMHCITSHIPIWLLQVIQEWGQQHEMTLLRCWQSSCTSFWKATSNMCFGTHAVRTHFTLDRCNKAMI